MHLEKEKTWKSPWLHQRDSNHPLQARAYRARAAVSHSCSCTAVLRHWRKSALCKILGNAAVFRNEDKVLLTAFCFVAVCPEFHFVLQKSRSSQMQTTICRGFHFRKCVCVSDKTSLIEFCFVFSRALSKQGLQDDSAAFLCPVVHLYIPFSTSPFLAFSVANTEHFLDARENPRSAYQMQQYLQRGKFHLVVGTLLSFALKISGKAFRRMFHEGKTSGNVGGLD